MNFHPYAEIFPLIDDGDFDELTSDIKMHGLREPIWTYEGQILDGRNRFMACAAARVQPQFREYKGKDALGFVLSLNIHRRHLNESQRAMVAAKIANMAQGERTDLRPIGQPDNLRPIGRTSQADAAEQLKVGERSLRRAKQVIEKGSKALQKAVESGEVAVSKAATVVGLPKAQQLSAAKAKPAPEPELDDPERPDDIDEAAALAAAEQELFASAQKALGTDAYTEIKRLTAELSVVKMSRDGYMNGKAEVTRLLKAEQRKCERLERENKKLRERIEAMEGA